MEVNKKKKKNNYEKSVYRSMAMITQFGINMLVPIILCSVAGIYLDKWLGTSFLMIVLFFVGALAGFRNIYIFSKKIISSGKSEELAAGKRKTVTDEKNSNSALSDEIVGYKDIKHD